jgi:xanthine dehydrogenase YagS FAD-binding subunit
MKSFINAGARDVRHAVTLLRQTHQDGRTAALAGGGSDLLGMMKDRLVTPDVLVSLRGVKGLDQVTRERGAVTIGGLITLDALANDALVRRQYRVLAEAAENVATPQIRNVATLAGNVCQRPWCWYYRNGFKCFKNGGSTCYSVSGENQFHAIFGAGPSYIVHPSDTAAALVALDATFRIAGPTGERAVPAAEFFTLPKDNAARENVLADGDMLASVVLPLARAGVRSTYHKIMDREAWTHAVVSAAIVLEMDGEERAGGAGGAGGAGRAGRAGGAGGEGNAGGICRSARIVLGGVAPIPWRLPEVERLLAGRKITPELAAQAGEAAVAGARPLAKNAYKIPLTRAMVQRTLVDLSIG